MPDHRGDLWIANTVSDLIEGDVQEHLPLEAIPLKGDVLGLGTTTSFENGSLQFRVVNHGAMDVSAAGVSVVVDDSYATHRDLRLPWLFAGGGEQFSVPLELAKGEHRHEVIADPQRQILKTADLQSNNRAVLAVRI